MNRLAFACVLSSALVLPAFLAACEEKQPSTKAAASSPKAYTTRGIITHIPPPDQPKARAGAAPSLSIHHERIPSFLDRKGQDVGMNEMNMPFPWVDPKVKLDGLKVGDKVEFEFVVDWSQQRYFVLTRIQPLPADATLNLAKTPIQQPGKP